MTPRDRQVVLMLESGLTAPTVAREMGLSLRSIERVRAIHCGSTRSEDAKWRRDCVEGSRKLREATARVYGELRA